LFAYFAARLTGIPTHGFDAVFNSWGLAVRQDGAVRAASEAKHRSTAKQRPGRKGASSRAPTTTATTISAFREWLLIDELKLGLEVAIVTFPGDGAQQVELLNALRQTAGVRHIIETQRDRSIMAIVVFADAEHRRHLRAQFEELAERLYWDDVLYETQEPSILMWRDLAHRAATVEGLI
jgi:hypothetical protein